MERIIKTMEEKYLLPSLDMVEATFTASEDAQVASWSALWWRRSAASDSICGRWNSLW
mgnify:CR=1 FL=1